MSTLKVFVPNKPGITVEQYEMAKTRYLQGESAATIAKEIGCKRHLLDTRFSRDGLPAVRNQTLKKGREGRTKDKLGEVLENLADGMVAKPAKGSISMNLQADTAGKVAKAASLLYGWGENPLVAVIVAGDITGEAAVEPEPIEI